MMRCRWCGAGGAVAVAVVLVVAVVAVVGTVGGGAVGARDEPEDAGDTAEFVVTVEGEGAARCAGALVALRAALTSARCARAPELWVRAAGGPRAASALVRVLRVAVADIHTDSSGGVAGAEGPWVWGGVGADLALLQLEETVRGTRPILAAVGGECEPRASCYVPRVRARRLRVVPAAVEPPVRCVSRGARWPSPLQERTLCVLGARLCAADWGSAVVCGGKLCGVVSRSAQSDERYDDDDVDVEEVQEREREREREYKNETECGDTHAAASVPRAHRFMRCAMLHGACGRGECERVCAERWLHGGPTTRGGTRAPAPAPAPPSLLRAHHHHKEDSPESGGSEGSVTERGGTQPEPEPEPEAGASVVTVVVAPVAVERRGGDARGDTTAAGASEETGARTDACGATRTGTDSFEFEPNRADFKMTPARTTAVCLKAGEYGDNAADYGAGAGAGAGEEGAPATCTGPSPAPPTRTSPAAPAVLHAEMEARVSSAPSVADTVQPFRVPGFSSAPPPPPPPRGVTLPPLLLAATCLLV